MTNCFVVTPLNLSARLITLASTNTESEIYYVEVRGTAESDFSNYRSIDFNHGPKLDVFKAEELDRIFAAYEDSCYDEYTDVDFEHLVAKREALDSGKCNVDIQSKVNFANDLESVALATLPLTVGSQL